MALQFRDVNVLSQDQAHWFLSVPLDQGPFLCRNFEIFFFGKKDEIKRFEGPNYFFLDLGVIELVSLS